MLVARVEKNRGRKFLCAVLFLIGAMSLFTWHLVIDGGQQKWLITFLAIKRHLNTSQNTQFGILKKTKATQYGFHADLKKSVGILKNSAKSKSVLKTESFPIKVLIISRGRSGSSFLGDLFNENKNAFYLFEPLGWSSKNPRSSKDKAFKILDDLYKCKFTEKTYLDFLMRSSSFRRKSKKLATFPGQCSHLSRSASVCLSKILRYSCLHSKSVIVKVLTHRLPDGGLWGIQKILDANGDLRIIQLIRDPRRVIASMMKAGWFKGKNFTSQVQLVCNSVWENIKHVRSNSGYFKSRYKLLVFNDMMIDPYSTVGELYDFLNMGSVPQYIFSWITRNTMGTTQNNKRRSTYKTYRNSTEVLNRKVDFKEFEDKIIDKYCGNVVRFIDQVRKNNSASV